MKYHGTLSHWTRKALKIKVTKKQFTSCSKFKSPEVDSSGSFTWTAPAKPEVIKSQLLQCIILLFKVYYFVCSVGDHCKVINVIFMNVLSVPKTYPILKGGFNESWDQGGKKLQWQKTKAPDEFAQKEEDVAKPSNSQEDRNIFWNIGRMVVPVSAMDLQKARYKHTSFAFPSLHLQYY